MGHHKSLARISNSELPMLLAPLFKGYSKLLKARRRARIRFDIQCKVGDIRHDCDGFNHIITRIEIIIDAGKKPPAGWVFAERIFYYHNHQGEEISFCGCPTDHSPKTKTEIYAWLKGWAIPEDLAKMKNLNGLVAKFARGEDIIDDSGVPYEEKRT